MTLERGAHKGRPYAMSIPVGATLWSPSFRASASSLFR
jgi:hypothetical protein